MFDVWEEKEYLAIQINEWKRNHSNIEYPPYNDEIYLFDYLTKISGNLYWKNKN